MTDDSHHPDKAKNRSDEDGTIVAVVSNHRQDVVGWGLVALGLLVGATYRFEFGSVDALLALGVPPRAAPGIIIMVTILLVILGLRHKNIESESAADASDTESESGTVSVSDIKNATETPPQFSDMEWWQAIDSYIAVLTLVFSVFFVGLALLLIPIEITTAVAVLVGSILGQSINSLLQPVHWALALVVGVPFAYSFVKQLIAQDLDNNQ